MNGSPAAERALRWRRCGCAYEQQQSSNRPRIDHIGPLCAARLRTMADTSPNRDMATQLFDVAHQYERLAEQVERPK